ncbi:MAG TPA: hypothetical protein VNL37_02260 [Candidatus Polarisedimenticolia bacterium]|nr:hypothetical protein [Candidatus Polarisedimenticolia bacterium]
MSLKARLRRNPQGGNRGTFRKYLGVGLVALGLVVLLAYAADLVPTDIKMPGTQPAGVDNPPSISSFGNCGCHNFNNTDTPELSPVVGWSGGMMANAGRDPLFWGTLAIAEQDFLPQNVWAALGVDPPRKGGVGDLCLKCHAGAGWLAGRSTPTDGSGLDPMTDNEGVACELCHFITNPDEDETPPGTLGKNAQYAEEQNPPFLAYDETTGDGYYGGAEYVLNSYGDRIGPFQAEAKHPWIQSPYFRDGRFCGTCHDVSNPAVGDLAPNHGSMAAFTGVFSGVPNGAVEGKAALNNPPHTYGIVERTFSEWLASDVDTFAVNNFNALPDPDLKTPGGAFARAYAASLRGFCSVTTDQACSEDFNCPSGEVCLATTADFADGTTRYYTCQTCHMASTGGKAAVNGPIRPDAPRHDQTGGSYWVQDAILHEEDNNTLVFGSGLSSDQRTWIVAGQARARQMLRSAARLTADQVGSDLEVKVTNLTGHKMISGYPEGRRMWVNVQWFDGPDGTGTLVAQNGAYGPIGVAVQDRNGVSHPVESILDLTATRVYEAKPAMTQDWAALLIAVGYDPNTVLSWNRLTNLPDKTLGDLAAEASGADYATFHFALNNTVHKDDRIPPLGFDYDTALERNALPVPDSQFGNPGPGGKFDHWDTTAYDIPTGARSAVVRLLYQSTSWEYIQFLWKQSDGTFAPGSNPPCDTSSFLGCEGVNLLDAWLNTGMSAPFEMASTTANVTAIALSAPGDASGPQQTPMTVTGYDSGTGAIALSFSPACDAQGHTIHYGPLATLPTYGWEAADCSFGVAGDISFTPDPAVGDSIFWVIVGNNADWEGSYGTDSAMLERPPDTTAAGVCYREQNLAPVCQ